VNKTLILLGFLVAIGTSTVATANCEPGLKNLTRPRQGIQLTTNNNQRFICKPLASASSQNEAVIDFRCWQQDNAAEILKP
jgi:hypothetical protein